MNQEMRLKLSRAAIRGIGLLLLAGLAASGCAEAEKPNIVSPTAGVADSDMETIKQILKEAGHTEPIAGVIDTGLTWAVSLEPPPAPEAKSEAGTLSIGTLAPPKNLTIDKATKKIVGSL